MWKALCLWQGSCQDVKLRQARQSWCGPGLLCGCSEAARRACKLPVTGATVPVLLLPLPVSLPSCVRSDVFLLGVGAPEPDRPERWPTCRGHFTNGLPEVQRGEDLPWAIPWARLPVPS